MSMRISVTYVAELLAHVCQQNCCCPVGAEDRQDSECPFYVPDPCMENERTGVCDLYDSDCCLINPRTGEAYGEEEPEFERCPNDKYKQGWEAADCCEVTSDHWEEHLRQKPGHKLKPTPDNAPIIGTSPD